MGLGLEIVSGGASAESSNTRLQWSLIALRVQLAATFGPLLGVDIVVECAGVKLEQEWKPSIKVFACQPASICAASIAGTGT